MQLHSLDPDTKKKKRWGIIVLKWTGTLDGLTDSQAYLLLLVGQAIIVVEVKDHALHQVSSCVLVQGEKYTEVALTAYNPDWIPGALQIIPDLSNSKHILNKL